MNINKLHPFTVLATHMSVVMLALLAGYMWAIGYGAAAANPLIIATLIVSVKRFSKAL